MGPLRGSLTQTLVESFDDRREDELRPECHLVVRELENQSTVQSESVHTFRIALHLCATAMPPIAK